MRPINSYDSTIPHRPNWEHTVRHQAPFSPPRPQAANYADHYQYAHPHANSYAEPTGGPPNGNPTPPAQAPGQPGQMHRPEPPRPRYMDYAVLAGAAFFTLIIVSAGLLFLVFLLTPKHPQAVTVQSLWTAPIQVSAAQPEAAIPNLNAQSVDRPFTVYDRQRTWSLTAANLGIQIDGEETARRAAQAARAGTTTTIEPTYRLNQAQAYATLFALSTQVNIAPSGLTPGRQLNIGRTIEGIQRDLALLMQSGTLQLAVDEIAVPKTIHVVQQGEELALIARKYNVSMQIIMELNNLADPNRIYPGQQLVIPAPGIYQPTQQDAPPAPVAQGKAMVVSLSQQRIYAYENGQLVRSTLVSTGLPGLDAALGDYYVYAKYVTAPMAGPGYDIPDVPFTMYFFSGYAIHGAYWHNVFGRRASHGCINLPVEEARWFYEFAPMHTLVRLMA